MTQVLYNLRTSELGYRVTKFTDGEVESSYLTSDQACDCPAGHRTSCRHRQMLPQMLARHLANSDLFWDFDRGFSCDINGNAKRETVACAPAEQDTERRTRLLDACTKFAEDLAQPMPHPNMFIDPHAVLAGQHTAAASLPPEQTVRTSPAWRRL